MKEELTKNLRTFKKLCSLSRPAHYENFCENGRVSLYHSIAVLEQIWMYLTLKLFPDCDYSPHYTMKDFCIVYSDIPMEYEGEEFFMQCYFGNSWISDYVGYYYMQSENWIYRCTNNGIEDTCRRRELFMYLFGEYLDESFCSRTQEMEQKPEDLLCDDSVNWVSSMVFFKSLLLAKYERIKRRIPRRLRYLKKAIEKAKRVLEGFGKDNVVVGTEEAVYFFSVLDENEVMDYGDPYVGIFSITPAVLYAGKIIDDCIAELDKEMHFLQVPFPERR